MVALLVWQLLVPLLVVGLVWWIIQQFPLPAPFGQIAQVVVVVVCVIILISFLLNFVGGGPVYHWRY